MEPDSARWDRAGKGQEPMYREFHLNTRRNFFTVRLTTHGTECPERSRTLPPSLEISQPRLCHVLWDEKGRGTRRSAVLPSHLTHALCDPAGDMDTGLREELPELPWKSRDIARIPQLTPPQTPRHHCHAGMTSPGHAPLGARRGAWLAEGVAGGRGLMEGACPGGGRGVRRRQRHVDGGPLLRGEGVSAVLGGPRGAARGIRDGPGQRRGWARPAQQRGRPAERGASSGRGSVCVFGGENGGQAPPCC